MRIKYDTRTKFQKDQDRFLMQLIGVIFLVLLALWLADNVRVTKEVMAIEYCFEELADGSLYHYVCEK